MTDFSDAVIDMTGDLLAAAGESCVYIRGTTSTTITLRKSQQQTTIVETDNGQVTEVAPVDFIGLTTAFPYDTPLRGDLIVVGGRRYEVQPAVGEKVFRRISEQMTRVHTKQIR